MISKIIYTLNIIYYNIGCATVSDTSNVTVHSSHSDRISDTQSDQELSGESQREYL